VNLPVFLRAEAEANIRQARSYLDAIRQGLGQYFAVRLSDLLKQLEASPEMYGVVLQDIRAARLKGFRYVVYYVLLPGKVEVLAVLHGARHSSEWQSRL
jgi:plasmid stabilization system protein ParE